MLIRGNLGGLGGNVTVNGVLLNDDPEAVYQALLTRGGATAAEFTQDALKTGTDLFTQRNIASQIATGKPIYDPYASHPNTSQIPADFAAQQKAAMDAFVAAEAAKQQAAGAAAGAQMEAQYQKNLAAQRQAAADLTNAASYVPPIVTHSTNPFAPAPVTAASSWFSKIPVLVWVGAGAGALYLATRKE